MPPLYIVGTPLGNLNDISSRAIETLTNSDLILCESIRHSTILLDNLSIKGVKVISFREENKKRVTPEIIQLLKDGKHICLISDAGMPSISDPGSYLINEVFNNALTIFCIPGAIAFASSLSICGFSSSEAVFLGFLPRKRSAIVEKINFYLQRETVIVFYESPHRLIETLEIIKELDSGAKVLIAKEMTKKYEEYIRGEIGSILQTLYKREIRGEITVVLKPTGLQHNNKYDERLLNLLIKENIGTKKIANIMYKLYNIPSRSIYSEIIRRKGV